MTSPSRPHDVRFVPVRVKAWDDQLRTTVVHSLGYRAVCSCGERSRPKRNKRELRTWRRAHLNHVK